MTDEAIEGHREPTTDSDDAATVGVRGIAVLSVVGGVLGLLVSVLLLGRQSIVVTVLGVGVAAAQLAVGYGLWYVRPWAFRAAVAVWGLTALFAVLPSLGGSPVALVTLAVSLGVVASLNGNRDLFRD